MGDTIDNVIAKILNGTATKGDQDFLEGWLKEDQLNQEIFDKVEIYWRLNNKELEIINEAEVRNKIWRKVNEPKYSTSRDLLPWVYRVAVVLVFALTFVFLIRGFSGMPNEHTDIVAFNTIEKENLAGVKSKIHLPDGSIINLNAESSIKFTEGFKDSIRWVELCGEAYFDVAKNPEKPFIVKTGDVYTKALGTAFNINACTGDSVVNVSLIEGKVEVNFNSKNRSAPSTFLEAGQFVSFQNEKIIGSGFFDYEKVAGWKDGIIIFENADYNTVAKKLEKWYGVKIEFEGKKPLWNLDAKFENASLEQILNVLSHSERFEFQLLEDTIKLKNKMKEQEYG